VKRFRLVALGGTFDSLHKGHKELLKNAFEIGEKVLIGVTDDEFAEKLHKPHNVDSFKLREKELEKFLKELNVLERAVIFPLKDPYGPTAFDEGIEAIIVSDETEKVAYEINRIRREKSLEPLKVVSVKMVLAENGKPISSTRIRRYEIDRDGRLLHNV
jgi:pantetheine-phosphate adenylyltransferase